jgi:hypothetical protein
MRAPTVLVDRRSIDVMSEPEHVFAEIERLGGAAGWPAWDVLWRVRGHIDTLVGGPGVRRGRRDEEQLEVGDHLDFWRVEALERPGLLRLRAEMRLPGRAWLQYEIERLEVGSRLVQSAMFDPDGIAGLAYWYLLLPVHIPIFRKMIGVLAKRAVRRGAAGTRPQPSGL